MATKKKTPPSRSTSRRPDVKTTKQASTQVERPSVALMGLKSLRSKVKKLLKRK